MQGAWSERIDKHFEDREVCIGRGTSGDAVKVSHACTVNPGVRRAGIAKRFSGLSSKAIDTNFNQSMLPFINCFALDDEPPKRGDIYESIRVI